MQVKYWDPDNPTENSWEMTHLTVVIWESPFYNSFVNTGFGVRVTGGKIVRSVTSVALTYMAMIHPSRLGKS